MAALSRAALLFFAVGAVGVVVWSIPNGPTVKRLIFVCAMAFGGVVVLAATLDTILARFGDEGNEASGETRTVMNLASVAMVEDKPLGVGWNNFAKAINHPYPYGDVIDDWNRERGQKVDPDYAKGVVESHYYLASSREWIPRADCLFNFHRMGSSVRGLQLLPALVYHARRFVRWNLCCVFPYLCSFESRACAHAVEEFHLVDDIHWLGHAYCL